ncbi:MAG: TlpA disulfide reductase family protein [Candidatus Kryptonium sp.]
MKKFLLFSLFLFFISCSQKEKPQQQVQNQLSPEVFTLAKIENPTHPDKAPNFSWKTPDGEVNLHEVLKNKVILINFWATWCGPCIKEIPDLIKIQNELGRDNFEIIGVSIDKSFSAVVEFAKNAGINYTLIHDPESKLLEAFGGSIGIPTTYLIHKDGKIVNKYVGARTKEVFVSDISKILK